MIYSDTYLTVATGAAKFMDNMSEPYLRQCDLGVYPDIIPIENMMLHPFHPDEVYQLLIEGYLTLLLLVHQLTFRLR